MTEVESHPPRQLAVRVGRAVVGVVRNNVLAVVTQALSLLLLAGVVLVPVLGLGVPVLAELAGVVRGLASVQRRWAGRELGVTVPDPYPSAVAGRTVWARLSGWSREPTTWRDLGWLAWQSLAGPLAGFAVLVPAALAYEILVVPEDAVGYLFSALVALPPAALALLLALPLNRVQAMVSRWLLADPAHRSEAAVAAARIGELTRSRTRSVDATAAELRRIERDLHDGTQAGLIALGLSLGRARATVRHDPDATDALLVEAQQAVATTLDELRALVRGIHPPVLAERGLPGALEALAVSAAPPVEAAVDLPGDLEPALESAVYFAVAEVLTNVGRHAGAEHAWLSAVRTGDRLRVRVVDDGVGGADAARGSGLAGIRDRLSSFDGTMTVTSPDGGPTEIVLELPCASSSPKTSPSSATASAGS